MSPVESGAREQGDKGVARVGRPLTRIDGPVRVCGLAEYPGNVWLPGMAHAALALSANARVTSIRRDEAEAMPGVLLILTHKDVGNAIGPIDHLMEGGWANTRWRPLVSSEIRCAGQIVAMVVAETSDDAVAAAAALRIGYEGQSPVATLSDPHCTTERLADVSAEHHDRRKGDLDAALAKAAVRIDSRYGAPIQHHNPIELRRRNDTIVDPVTAKPFTTRPLMRCFHGPRRRSRGEPAGCEGIEQGRDHWRGAAVANAVFNANGERIRNLPIRPETAWG